MVWGARARVYLFSILAVMRKFSIRILFFTIPLIIFIVFLELFFRSIPNEFSYKKDYLDKNAENIETLILGNSYSYFGVDPSYFSSPCFNAANTARHLYYDFKIFNKYKEEFKKLKVVVLPISFHSLGQIPQNQPEFRPWGIFNYTVYYDISNEFSIKNNFVMLNFPLANVRKTITKFAERKVNNDLNYGWSSLGWGNYYSSSHKVDMVKDGLNAITEHDSLAFSTNIRALTDFVDELNSRNIRVILITPPAFKTFRCNINLKNVQETHRTMDEITTKYDNCSYFDYFSSTIFEENDFFNSDHLNERGARKLSHLINDIVTDE